MSRRVLAICIAIAVCMAAPVFGQAVSGTIPTRPRSDNNPLDREEYLLRVKQGGPIG